MAVLQTSRGFLRSVLASALTQARTTTELLTDGILFAEGVTVTTDERPRGCFSLVPESREDGEEFSEDERDESGEAEATVRASCFVTTGWSLHDIGDAMIDAIQRALESYRPASRMWEHPEYNERIILDPMRPIRIGLITTAHIDKATQPVATVIIYPVIKYKRERS